MWAGLQSSINVVNKRKCQLFVLAHKPWCEAMTLVGNLIQYGDIHEMRIQLWAGRCNWVYAT